LKEKGGIGHHFTAHGMVTNIHFCLDECECETVLCRDCAVQLERGKDDAQMIAGGWMTKLNQNSKTPSKTQLIWK